MPEYKATKSERGFKQYEHHADYDGNDWYICESSLATEPAIRLFVKANEKYWPGQEAALHLTDAQARDLAQNIYAALRNHYHRRTDD